jgi:hypothetical protein
VSEVTFSSWIDRYPSLPANQRDLNDDFDKDGHTNLFEYAFEMNPTVADQAPSLESQMENDRLYLTYYRVRSDVVYTAKTSTNLSNWSTTGVDQGGAGLGEITASVAKGEDDKRFLHIHVELP